MLSNSLSIAASINFIGVQTNSGGNGFAVQNWSAAGVPKTYDLGGSEVYGTAGYYQVRPMPTNATTDLSDSASPGNNLGVTAATHPTLFSAPVFLNSITGGAGTFVNFAGYPLFLGSDGTTAYREGSLSVPVVQGPFDTPSGGNSGYFGEAFSFTAGMSATFRVGITVDSAATALYAPDYVSIYTASRGVGTVYSTQLVRDGNVDMAVFEIDAAAGDAFTAAVWQLSGSNSVVPFALITFDVSRYNFDVASGQSATNSLALGGAPAALLKTGEGTLVLSGSSTYQGATTISNGALEVGGAGALGAGDYRGTVSLAENATLRINTSARQTLAGLISGAGNITKGGSGTLTLAAPNDYTGSTTVTAGALVIANPMGSATGSGALTVGNGAILAGSGTVAGPVVVNGVLRPGVWAD